MEKLKNLINPGSIKDDEVMYGSGRSEEPVHSEQTNTGSTQAISGNNLSGIDTARQDASSRPSNAVGTSQNDTANPGEASHGLSEPYASRMPGAFDDDDAATTASVSSGIPGQSQSRSAWSGPNEPTYTEKSLPREPASETGMGHGQSRLSDDSLPDRSVENNSGHRDHFGLSDVDRDTAFGAGAVGTSAHRQGEPHRDHYTHETDRSFPLGGSSASDNRGSAAAGPHPSSLANKADPRVDSEGPHTAANTGYGSTPAGSRSRTGASSSNDQGSLGRGALEAGAVAGAGVGAIDHGPESWQHDHRQHGHQFKGDPCETETPLDGPHFVSGPHITDTANRLDPHVGSGGEGLATTGESHHGQLGALGAEHRKQHTTGHATSSKLDSSSRHGRDTTRSGEYGDDRSSTTGVSSTGRTAGPHKSDILNRLDPRVDSALSEQQGPGDNDHHYGHDVALTGAGGAGSNDTEKYRSGNKSSLADLATASSAGGQSSYGTDLDHHVDATGSGTAKDYLATPATKSGRTNVTKSAHDPTRDVGLVGAGGIGAYEAGKHLSTNDRSDPAVTPQERLAGSGHQPVTVSGSSSDPPPSFNNEGQLQSGSRIGRDPPAAGPVGTGSTYGGGQVQSREDYGATGSQAQVLEHQHPGASMATYPSQDPITDSEERRRTSHPTGRDAVLIGGAGALAGHDYSHKDAPHYGNELVPESSRGYQGNRHAAIVEPGVGAKSGDDTRGSHHAARDTTALAAAGLGADASAGHATSQRDVAGDGSEPPQGTSREQNYGRDAAILGGAAGVGGLAEHEHSKKDASRLHKEHVKEEKAVEKENLKEVKYHNKELAREEKARDKAFDKSEKKHEKAVEKDETRPEHEGKKHGGILGFLHRDKPDKDLKEDEARRQGAVHSGRGEEETAAGVGYSEPEPRSGYDQLQGEHGSESGVHENPIGMGSGLTTHDAYGVHDTGHNKLHKNPPSKIVESRGYEFQ